MASGNALCLFLEPYQEEEGHLRVENLPPGDPGRFERPRMSEREDVVPVLADLTEVVHGTLSESGSPATLVVMDFWGRRYPNRLCSSKCTGS